MRLSMTPWATKKRPILKNRVGKKKLLAMAKQILIQKTRQMKSTRHKKGEKIENNSDEKIWGYKSFSKWTLTIWNSIDCRITCSKMVLLTVRNNSSTKLKQARQMRKTWKLSRRRFYSLDKEKMKWIWERAHLKEREKRLMTNFYLRWAHPSIDSKLIRTKKIFKNWSPGYLINTRIRQTGLILLSSKWWNRWWTPFRKSNSLR